jgi:16S rRNA (adenine1518-N6/adenine1519-N6)-dimethyltransferase
VKKRFGQHFLRDRSILQRIVRFAGIRADDTVLEIGPGRGALTRELAAVARHVIAIEVDRDLIGDLRASLPANVTVIEGDALRVPWPDKRFRVVANLPYNVGTPLIQRFIEARARIEDVTVMLQKEVAERIGAAVGTGAYGPLSILVQYYAHTRYGFTVPPGAFTPRPKVDSAVIRLEWKPGVPAARGFTDFVHQLFFSRRKTLANNLARVAPQLGGRLGRAEIDRRLAALGIAPTARPEELSVEQFLDVYNRVVTGDGSR